MHNEHSLDAIKTQLPDYLIGLGFELKYTGENKFVCRCPLHDDRSPSFTATLKDGVWLWYCHPCALGGSIIDLHSASHCISAPDAIRELREKYEGNGSLPPAPLPSRKVTPAPAQVDSPPLHRGSIAELQAVATLRGLPLEAIQHADSLGLLRFGFHVGYKCYAFTDHCEDGETIQFRHMDGELFFGDKAKKTLYPKGTKSLPIGSRHLGLSDLPVLIAEGCVASLELLALAFYSDNSPHIPHWSLLALPSASYKKISESVMSKLHGRQLVRIIADIGIAGERAANRWAEQIHAHGIAVELVNLRAVPLLDRLDKPDLGDLLKLANSPEKTETIRTLITI